VVGVVQGVADPGDQLQPVARAEALRACLLQQRPAVDELHREERLAALAAILGARLVDAGDPRVLQLAEHLRLVAEAPQQPGRHHARADHLQRHAPPRLLLLGLVDDAHPALADDAHDGVAPDAGGQLHGRLVVAADRAGQ